ALIWSTISWAGVWSEPSPLPLVPGSLMTTLAPCAAISLATSAPTPRPAPAQIATRPSSMPMLGFPCSTSSGVVAGCTVFVNQPPGLLHDAPGLTMERSARGNDGQRDSVFCHQPGRDRADDRLAQLRDRYRPADGSEPDHLCRSLCPGN